MKTNRAKNIVIRRLAISDVPLLVKLISQIESTVDLSVTASAQFYDELISDDGEGVRFVAVIGTEIIGTMGCAKGPIPSGFVLWADWLVVDKDYRGLGVASMLYEHVEHFAFSKGKRYLCLDMGDIDVQRAAYEFHSSNGFEVVGRLSGYWGGCEDLNIMAKFIGSEG